MFKKICYLTICSILAISSLLTAIEYEIQDIGTLQTKASEAIAINNNGQILGWYNIDESSTGKHFFVRDRDGTFHEIVESFSSEIDNFISCSPPIKALLGNGNIRIDWRYLTDDGRVYGTINHPNISIPNLNLNLSSMLFMWDKHNGVVKFDNLPSNEIVAINNAGQVLIKSVVEVENGRTIRRPVIWENGLTTKLYGLEGEIGIESEASYGLDMNNKGEVVGSSIANLSYKNTIYKQVRAVKWVNGHVLDIHQLLPKNEATEAISINDYGNILINMKETNERFLVKIDGSYVRSSLHQQKLSNGYSYGDIIVFKDPAAPIICTTDLTRQVQIDRDSIWASVKKIIKVTDKGKILAQGRTIYGEEHAMLLNPVESK